MASLDLIRIELGELRNRILIAMQEEDDGEFDDQFWQDQIFLAWELLGLVVRALERVGDLSDGN
jgi:hypothetical protein